MKRKSKVTSSIADVTILYLKTTRCLYSHTDDLRGECIVPPAKKLEDLIHLTELCVDLLQQNEEHYAEVNYHSYIDIFVISLLIYRIGLILNQAFEF